MVKLVPSAAGEGQPGGPMVFRLQVPADANVLRVVRLVASGVASFVQFDLAEIEDIRIAVDELCVALLNCADDGGELSLELIVEPGRLEVHGSVPAAQPDSEGFEGLTAQILAVVADECELRSGDGQVEGRVVKLAADA